jgi:lysophospholipase L1-like esterase
VNPSNVEAGKRPRIPFNVDGQVIRVVDDDAAGFIVSSVSGDTTEAGGTASFTVRLATEPTADVTIDISSSDTSEGTVDKASLTFRAANWSTPQTVTVRGVDDSVVDGNMNFDILLALSKVKVMPLGDSITRGKNNTITDPNYMVGYRQKLYLDLVNQGYNVNFVGSQSNGQLAMPAFDTHHEGHGAMTDATMAANVHSYLVNSPANVVLLHIGTNGLDTSPAHVENILNEIDRYSTNTTVILARIINRRTYSSQTTLFNDNVVAMATNRIAIGDDIVIVDQESALTYPDDMEDYLHPNTVGYNKMADTWRVAVQSLIDIKYSKLDPSDVSVMNVDDDIAGITKDGDTVVIQPEN